MFDVNIIEARADRIGQKMKTKHMSDRMNGRGITQEMVDLAFLAGSDQGDRVVLCRKQAQDLLQNVRRLKVALWKTYKSKNKEGKE